jgi:hypothetical protein
MPCEYHPTTFQNIRVGIEAPDVRRDRDYFVLSHGSQYVIVIRNDNPERVSAEVNIDGTNQGTFVVNAYNSIRLERPSSVAQKFTFLLADSDDAKAAGISHGDTENGLIQIKCFREEQVALFQAKSTGASLEASFGSAASFRGDTRPGPSALDFNTTAASFRGSLDSRNASDSYRQGGTGLTGTSEQRFNTTTFKSDPLTECTFYLRLVGPGSNATVRPLPGKESLVTRVPPLPLDPPSFARPFRPSGHELMR